MADGVGLDPWWEEPTYRAASTTFPERGAFILAKVRAHDAAKLHEVLTDLYRNAIPAPEDVTKFEWEVILRYLGATTEEVKDVQVRMVDARSRPLPQGAEGVAIGPIVAPRVRGGLSKLNFEVLTRYLTGKKK